MEKVYITTPMTGEKEAEDKPVKRDHVDSCESKTKWQTNISYVFFPKE